MPKPPHPSSRPTPTSEVIETVVGLLPPGQYELRPRADGMIQIINIAPPPKPGQGFWNGLQPLDE